MLPIEALEVLVDARGGRGHVALDGTVGIEDEAADGYRQTKKHHGHQADDEKRE
jgi:hypothetical protein